MNTEIRARLAEIEKQMMAIEGEPCGQPVTQCSNPQHMTYHSLLLERLALTHPPSHGHYQQGYTGYVWKPGPAPQQPRRILKENFELALRLAINDQKAKGNDRTAFTAGLESVLTASLAGEHIDIEEE